MDAAHLDENTVAELQAGVLSPEELDVVNAHVDRCEQCRQLLIGAARHGVDPRAPVDPSEQSAVLLGKGDAVGRYVVSHLVGAGGMGRVYAAYDLELDRRVALKLLAPDRDHSEWRTRLIREAQTMARVSHPNVVTVYDVGSHAGSIFVAMEFCEGQTLGQWLKAAARTPREVISRFLDAGVGLSAAHAAGIIHRDFKPENVLIGTDGRVRVTDFGLARAQPPAIHSAPAAAVSAQQSITQTGALLGTPAYMAPEQFQAKPLDARSDQFSFCVSLFEALTGKRPYRGDTLEEARRAVLSGAIDADAAKRLPRNVAELVLRGLRVDPNERWPDMEPLLAQLRRYVEAPRRRRRLWAAAVLLAVLAGSSAAFLLRRAALCRGSTLRMAAVWGPSQQQQVSEAFRKIPQPHMETTLANVMGRLNALAASWISERRSACEATHLEGEQSAEVLELRMACFDRQLRELDALVQVFTSADREVMENATSATAAVDFLRDCSNVALLRQTQAPTFATEEPLQPQIARAKAEYQAGHYKTAARLRTELLNQTSWTAGSPSRAKLLMDLAGAYSKLGEGPKSRQTVFEAIHAAEASGSVELQAEAWLYRGQMLLDDDVDVAQARQSLQHATSLLVRLPDVPRLHLMRMNLETWLARREGRSEDAIKACRALVERSIRERGPTALETGKFLSNLASLLSEAGRYEEADEVGRRALQMRQERLGPNHPVLATPLQTLAQNARRRNRPEEALAYAKRALEIRRANAPEGNLTVAMALRDIGLILVQLGQRRDAQKWNEESLALLEKLYPKDHPSKAVTLLNMASNALSLGQQQEAETLLARACSMMERTRGDQSAPFGSCLSAQARALSQRGKRKEALALSERACAIRERALGPTHPELAVAFQLLGELQLENGQAAAAAKTLRRVLALRMDNDSDESADGGKVRFHLAMALARTSSGPPSAEAVELAQSAKGIFLSRGDPASARQVEQWIAQQKRASTGF